MKPNATPPPPLSFYAIKYNLYLIFIVSDKMNRKKLKYQFDAS